MKSITFTTTSWDEVSALAGRLKDVFVGTQHEEAAAQIAEAILGDRKRFDASGEDYLLDARTRAENVVAALAARGQEPAWRIRFTELLRKKGPELHLGKAENQARSMLNGLQQSAPRSQVMLLTELIAKLDEEIKTKAK